MSRFILFLDVDGVLHPATWEIPGDRPDRQRKLTAEEFTVVAAMLGMRAVPQGLPFSRLPLFEQTVRPHLDALEIVITSSWRLVPERYDSILQAMSADVRSHVVGATPKAHERPLEIKKWLRERNDPTALPVILDDDADHPWRHLWREAVIVFTEMASGFVEQDARALKNILSLDPIGVAEFKQALRKLSGRDERLEWVERRLTKPSAG